MNEDYKIKECNKKNEFSLKEILPKIKKAWNYLLSKWLIILAFCLIGSACGLIISLMSKPRYTASLSFALVENSSTSSIVSLASSFGFTGLSSGNDDVFSGDNLLKIIQSRHAIEQTLLIPVTYQGKKQNLVEVYIQFNSMREQWQNNSNNTELCNLTFPIGQKRETFSRTQDSVLFSIYKGIANTQSLKINREDENLGIVKIDYTSTDEVFSKLFVEKLMDETYQFYSDTRTSQSRANIAIMQRTADSIKRLYESSLYSSASISPVNINPAIQIAAVPKIKQEANAKLYGTVYAEVLKNLETLKMDMARGKPIIQIIDAPRFPLKKERFGKAKGLVYGGFLGGILIVLWLFGSLYFKKLLKEEGLQV